MRKDRMLKSGFAQKTEQAALREQYGVEQQEVTVRVVSPIKQILELAWTIAKAAARIALIIAIALLAIIGLSAILYPNLRAELVKTMSAIFLEFKRMLGV